MSCESIKHRNELSKQVWYSFSDGLRRDSYLSVGGLNVVLAEDGEDTTNRVFPFLVPRISQEFPGCGLHEDGVLFTGAF
jgi:hypothetical protein